jgi:hypothetical protein
MAARVPLAVFQGKSAYTRLNDYGKLENQSSSDILDW